MTLIKYNQGLLNLENRRFSNFIDRFFSESLNTNGGDAKSFNPQVDIAEDKLGFELSLAVPGMKKSDFKIDMSDGKITISGERKLENENKAKSFHSLETQYGAFSRSFYLPENVKDEKVEAIYQDGILKVMIPKDEKKELHKTIQIK
jgi:HSP20 family protein